MQFPLSPHFHPFLFFPGWCGGEKEGEREIMGVVVLCSLFFVLLSFTLYTPPPLLVFQVQRERREHFHTPPPSLPLFPLYVRESVERERRIGRGAL